MMNYFDTQITACKVREQALIADNRASEAVFAKIQGNVYDIFRTVYSVGSKAGEGFFLTKLEEIPQSWRTALEAAEAHGDTEKAHIERLKLDVVEEIKTELERRQS